MSVCPLTCIFGFPDNMRWIIWYQSEPEKVISCVCDETKPKNSWFLKAKLMENLSVNPVSKLVVRYQLLLMKKVPRLMGNSLVKVMDQMWLLR